MEKNVDLKQARKDWESGISARAVAAAHHCSHTKINQLIKIEGWERSSESAELSQEVEQQKLDDSTDEVENQRKAVETAEAELARVKGKLEVFRADVRCWKSSIKKLEALRHEVAAHIYENCDVLPGTEPQITRPELENLDKIMVETTLLHGRIESVQGVEQHLQHLEKEARNKLTKARLALEKIEGGVAYLQLREELIANPREITTGEDFSFRGVAVRSGYRDDYDKFVPALKHFLYKKRRGVVNETFTWPQ